MAGENASPEDVEAIRRTYGFDRPIWEQYLTWVGRFVAGDFGRSHYLKLGVGEVLAEHMPVTATLGVLALAFALALSIPLGVAGGAAGRTPSSTASRCGSRSPARRCRPSSSRSG